MKTPAHDPSWLYFKLYPGPFVDRADALLDAAVRCVQDTDAGLPWFYLRYFDSTGFHLRLRVKPAAGQHEAIAQRLGDALKDLLGRLGEMPANVHQPMVLPRGAKGDPLAAFSHGKEPRLELDRYEPEYDKYGGVRGTPLAEAFFTASSRIAAAILRDERAGHYQRKTIAPWLMQLCFDAFEPAQARRYFRQYSLFWLGGDTPAAEDWRDRFFAKASALRAQGVALLPRDEGMAPAAVQRLAEWREALAHTVQAYAQAGRSVHASNDVLSFNFSHLMNNRLGLSALEEAYLATLLEDAHMNRGMEVAA